MKNKNKNKVSYLVVNTYSNKTEQFSSLQGVKSYLEQMYEMEDMLCADDVASCIEIYELKRKVNFRLEERACDVVFE